ncbi:hypothetical protein DYB28_015940 [Aphanomyces astaci]|uniref:Uncharacterized protein n=1 Tax=Aphanomyces astaci TaxID=112090 RepID=A0A9X8ECV7_APHAT|nr:hypothetical protein DYB28_015940 [Aphanomyces astaci]
MSFLSRFENKISTVTMHGTLRRADGVEEVRSGPMRRKPQPSAMVVTQPDNNRDHNSVSARYDDENDDDDQDSSYTVVQASAKATSQHPQQLAKQQQPPHGSSPRRGNPQPLPPASLSPKPTYTTPLKPSKPPQNSPDDEDRKGTISTHDYSKLNTHEDQLAFSKKARPVSYEPCTLSEYRQEKHDKYYELGKLQPDLNATELVEKRANQERVKEFSKNLRQINQSIPKKSATTVDDKASPKTMSTRDKALAFAKQNVPKPKTRKVPSPVKQHAAPRRSSKAAHVDETEEDDGGRFAGEDGAFVSNVMTELQQLQLKHRAARAQIEALMRDG